MMMSKSHSTNNKSTATPDDLLDDSSDDDYRDLPPPKCWDSFESWSHFHPALRPEMLAVSICSSVIR
jgi:hypothetical protein